MSSDAQINMQSDLLPIGAVQNQPTNINYLNTHRFRVILQRAPNVTYFCQEANLPGIGMGNAMQPTPFTDMPVPGDKVNFEDFTISFGVDEDMRNYKEIANWIIGLGFAREWGQYKRLYESEAGIRSDISLLILDSNHNVAHRVNLSSAFPVSISGISFDAKATDATIAYATAVFKYDYYEFDEVNQPV